jgi:hypothetical protein
VRTVEQLADDIVVVTASMFGIAHRADEGISTLQSLGLLSSVAKDGIGVVGVGKVAFKAVLSLHRTNPELFQTGGVSVVVPGVGEVAATWCDDL